MTAVVVWKRAFKQGTMELCFASDSRLRDGRTIDFAQKVFTLKRGDIAIAFAGDTAVAYPYVLQVINASDAFRASRTRGLDLIEYRSHIIRILNQIVNDIDTPIAEERIPNLEIILGGYSWVQKDFFIWKIRYQSHLKSFHYDTPKSFGGILDCISFAGDMGNKLKERFLKILYEKYGRKDFGLIKLDFEPLQAMAELLNECDQTSTIGGSPQFAKVYQHLNSVYIPLLLQDDKTISVCGRSLFEYERVDEWPLSLNTFERVNPQLIDRDETMG